MCFQAAHHHLLDVEWHEALSVSVSSSRRVSYSLTKMLEGSLDRIM